MAATLKPIQSHRKVDEGCRLLRALARKLGPGSKMPPIRELASELGISKATVGECLDDLETQDVITRRDRSGIYVSQRLGQKTIGLVFGGNIFAPSKSPIYAQLIDRCSQRAASHGENFRFFVDVPALDPHGRELAVHRDLEEAIRERKLHGILLVSRNSPQQEAWLRATNIPMFSLSMTDEQHVYMDIEGMVRMGVKALAKQGCKRLGMITPYGEHRNTPVDKDLKSWSSALRKAGLADSEPRIWQKLIPTEFVPPNETREDDGWKAAQTWFAPGSFSSGSSITSPDSRPDGVLCLDDMMTTGLLAGLHSLGLCPGRDVFVATLANAGSPALHRQQESLTLLQFDPDVLVQGMFDCLERRMNGQPDPTKPVISRPTLRVGSAVFPVKTQERRVGRGVLADARR